MSVALKKKSETSPPGEDEDEEGYGCTPLLRKNKTLRRLDNRVSFLIVFSLTCILQGTFHTYFVSVITTLERLLSIQSKTTGALMAATEIGQVSSSLILPYYISYSNGHRPHWMGFGALIFSLATLMCSTPHWLYSPPNNLGGTTPLSNNSAPAFCLQNETFGCDGNAGEGESSQNEGANKMVIYVIIFSSLLVIGLGQTILYTLGIPYLDDNISNKDSPLYFSITIGTRILGPVLGFVLGSFTTKVHINWPFEISTEKEIDKNSPQWLGAWWLGMWIISICLFFSGMLIYGFPKKLGKRRKKNGEERKNSALIELKEVAPPCVNNNVINSGGAEEALVPNSNNERPPQKKNFAQILRRLVSNKVLLLRTFSSVFHLLPIAGLYTFLPKFLESQFRLLPHQSNLITGISGIGIMGIGIFLSGFLLKKLKPNGKQLALWICVCSFCYAGGMFILMNIGCDNSEMIPLRTSDCSADCHCNDLNYDPICEISTKTNFFSPCHAGCYESDDFEEEESERLLSFKGCKCVPLLSGFNETSVFHRGQCESDCSNLIPYLVIFMVIVLLHSTSEVGSMLLTLRCVNPADKSMALGLIQCAIGVFGNVPCPVIYGAIVDSTCLIWSGSGCDDARGHCWIYNNKNFRLFFHGTTGAIMFLAFFFDLLVYFNYSNQIQV